MRLALSLLSAPVDVEVRDVIEMSVTARYYSRYKGYCIQLFNYSSGELHVDGEQESDKRRRLTVGMAPLRTLVAPSEELSIANEPSSGCPGRVLVPLDERKHLRRPT